jgi:peptide chain release factor subunit 1
MAHKSNHKGITKRKSMQHNGIEKQIEQVRLKKTIKELEAATGSGTSMISLFIPPGQLIRATKMLATEYGVSANIKSRV